MHVRPKPVENPEYLLFRLIGGKFSFLDVEQIVKGVAFDLGGNVAVGSEDGERKERCKGGCVDLSVLEAHRIVSNLEIGINYMF